MLYPDWHSAWTAWQTNWAIYDNYQTDAAYYIGQAQIHGFGAAGWDDLLNAVILLYLTNEYTDGYHGCGFEASPLNNLLYYSGQATSDMDGILDTMLTADTAQMTKFVGIEDAYRSATWVKPFNVEFYAALARDFGAWA